MTDLAHTTLDVVAGRRWFGGKRLVVLISLLLVICGAGAALYLVYGVDRQLDDVVHSYDVRNAARDLSQAVTDAETGQRGYLLTGDQSYLEPYHQALGTIDERLQALQEMTKDDPLQFLRVNAIVADVGAKREELTATVQMGQAGRLAQARETLRTDTGEKLMSNIRDGIGRLLALGTAAALGIDIVIELNAGHFIDREVDGRVIDDRHLEPVGEGVDADFELVAQRLGEVGVLDDVGAGFADGHLDFRHFLGVEAAPLGRIDHHLANARQGIGRAR